MSLVYALHISECINKLGKQIIKILNLYLLYSSAYFYHFQHFKISVIKQHKWIYGNDEV